MCPRARPMLGETGTKELSAFLRVRCPPTAFPAAVRLEWRCRHVPSRNAALKKTTPSHAHPKVLHICQGVALTIRSKTRDSDVRVGSNASVWPSVDDFRSSPGNRTGPHTPFYEESDATRAARLFRLAYGRRLRCLLKAHSGVGPDAPEHDLVPVMVWRGFVPAHGSRDARYAAIARRSCSSRLATTWAINGLHSPVRAPCWKS